jgi:queuosine precursor transporter
MIRKTGWEPVERSIMRVMRRRAWPGARRDGFGNLVGRFRDLLKQNLHGLTMLNPPLVWYNVRMSNELLFLLSVLINIVVIFVAARRGTDWLFGAIAVNLILIGIFGAKLISIFGFTTNAGNAFYACVFLATHFLLERHGKHLGLKAIWFGAGFILYFVAMSQFASQFVGLALSETVNVSISTLFSFSARITFASIIAYVFAQHLNVYLYEWLKGKTNNRLLWLRSNGANIVAQLVDSLLFFTLAFPELPGPLLVQTILVGWLTKTLVVSAGTPFLYLDSYLTKKL